MKQRPVSVVMTVLLVAVVFAAGYLYYSLRQSALGASERQAVSNTQIAKNRISSVLSENLKSAKVLAGLKELRESLMDPSPNTMRATDAILDHFKNALGVDVCYLMDGDGKTIASSNRNSSDSFVGKNYGFRPYFQQAIQDRSAVYMALGTTSRVPGVYYSHPVGKDAQGKPLGVAVIKAPIDSLEEVVKQNPQEIIMIIDPHNVVFITNRTEWLYRVLWKAGTDQLAQIAATKQFGEGPWTWTGLTLKDGNRVVDPSGNEFVMYQEKIDDYPGWNIVNLRSSRNF